MQVLTIRDIMSRLQMNPLMQDIGINSVAIYIKDFISVGDINIVKSYNKHIATIVDNKVQLPDDCDTVDEAYFCDEDGLSDLFFKDNQLTYSFSSTIARGTSEYGKYSYNRRGNFLFFEHDDSDERKVEIHYRAMPVDDAGFPTLFYDGSLLQAIENYIKYRYFTILVENKQMDQGMAIKAEQNYVWYLGQFKNKRIFENPEAAEAVMNALFTFTNTRSRTTDGDQYPQINNF